MNPENSKEPQIIITEGKNYTLLMVAVVILGLFIMFGYLYYSTVTTGQTSVVPVAVEIVPEETVPESIDIDQLMIEKLAEVDEGQGFVSIATSTAGDIYLTKVDTGQTLYHRTEGFCVDECLQNWVPYSTTTKTFEGDRLRSVLVNEEFNLHYLLLDADMLFTYTGDVEIGSTAGNGVDGVWTIARP